MQVNPFLLGAEENTLVARVVTVALMRAFNALLYRLNNKRRPQLQLEIISLQNIFDYTGVSADFLKDDRGRLNGYDQGWFLDFTLKSTVLMRMSKCIMLFCAPFLANS